METFHSFFQMRKRLESETKFFFLSSLFVLVMENKETFSPRSLRLFE